MLICLQGCSQVLFPEASVPRGLSTKQRYGSIL